MAERSKTHHYVPQLILKGFSNTKGQLTTIDLTTKKSFPQNVVKAAAENDYYSLQLVDGTTSDAVERTISALIEAPASAAIKRIRNGGWIESDAERQAIARLLAFQYTRGPWFRDSSNAKVEMFLKLQIAAGGLSELSEVMTELEGKEPNEAEVQELWENLTHPDTKMKATRERLVRESMKTVKEFADVLLGMYSWGVVNWDHGALLTSDTPLLLIPRGVTWPDSSPGIGTAKQICLGLGRLSAIVLLDDTSCVYGFSLTPSAERARALNRFAALSARRWLYHHPEDDIDELLGGDLALPTPQPFDHNTGHNAKVLNAVITASEYHHVHPDEPHPLSGLSSPIELPPDARPYRSTPD